MLYDKMTQFLPINRKDKVYFYILFISTQTFADKTVQSVDEVFNIVKKIFYFEYKFDNIAGGLIVAKMMKILRVVRAWSQNFWENLNFKKFRIIQNFENR